MQIKNSLLCLFFGYNLVRWAGATRWMVNVMPFKIIIIINIIIHFLFWKGKSKQSEKSKTECYAWYARFVSGAVAKC